VVSSHREAIRLESPISSQSGIKTTL
jgi:hypothetical protein